MSSVDFGFLKCLWSLWTYGLHGMPEVPALDALVSTWCFSIICFNHFQHIHQFDKGHFLEIMRSLKKAAGLQKSPQSEKGRNFIKGRKSAPWWGCRLSVFRPYCADSIPRISLRFGWYHVIVYPHVRTQSFDRLLTWRTSSALRKWWRGCSAQGSTQQSPSKKAASGRCGGSKINSLSGLNWGSYNAWTVGLVSTEPTDGWNQNQLEW